MNLMYIQTLLGSYAISRTKNLNIIKRETGHSPKTKRTREKAFSVKCNTESINKIKKNKIMEISNQRETTQKATLTIQQIYIYIYIYYSLIAVAYVHSTFYMIYDRYCT